MCTKKFTLVFVFLICTITFGQNYNAARKFYDKAQVAYEDNDIEKALKSLQLCDTFLKGAFNPDVVYLKGKIYHEYDINVYRAKKQFTLFLAQLEGDNDSRIDEVKSILSSINNSTLLDIHGNYKSLKGRNGSYFEYYNNGDIKKEIVYKTNRIVSRQEYFENGTIALSYPRDGVFKQYYQSGKLLTEGTVTKSQRTGVSLLNSEAQDLDANQNKTKVFISKKVLEFEERNIEKWASFLQTSNTHNLELYEGFTDFNLFDYDIIIWNCCQTYKYNQYLFDIVEDLLKKGKYIILSGSKDCYGRTSNDLNPITSSQEANRITKEYAIFIEETIRPNTTINVKQNDIFSEEFQIQTSTYAPITIMSKKQNKKAKKSRMLLENQNQECLLAVHELGRNRGKLFVHGLGSFFLQGGTEENNMLKVFETIVNDFMTNKK